MCRSVDPDFPTRLGGGTPAFMAPECCATVPYLPFPAEVRLCMCRVQPRPLLACHLFDLLSALLLDTVWLSCTEVALVLGF